MQNNRSSLELAAGSSSRVIRRRTAYCHVGAWGVDVGADQRLERTLFVGSAGAWVAHVRAVVLLILGAFREDQTFLLHISIYHGSSTKTTVGPPNLSRASKNPCQEQGFRSYMLSGVFRTTNDAASWFIAVFLHELTLQHPTLLDSQLFVVIRNAYDETTETREHYK